MSRRTWLAAILAAVPLAVGAVWGYSERLFSAGYTCPLTGEELPCPKCCPLNNECPCPDCCPCPEVRSVS